jgi:hypothetical protein
MVVGFVAMEEGEGWGGGEAVEGVNPPLQPEGSMAANSAS